MGGRPPLPHSSKLRIVERFRQTAPGTLVDEMTFSDPDVYVASWIEMRTYRYRADLKIQEFVCQENNRNVDPTNGATISFSTPIATAGSPTIFTSRPAPRTSVRMSFVMATHPPGV